MDSLPDPQFEADQKRSAAVQSAAKTPKTSSVLAPESGTSVAPRQRPKASATHAAAAPGQLPIALPPSPSPRNTLSSPIPSAPPAAPEPNEAFQAQFSAAFPPPDEKQQQQKANTGGGSAVEPKAEHLDSLFQTNYPDPFREPVAKETKEVGGGSGGSSSNPAASCESLPMVSTSSQDVMGPLVGTPTKPPQMLVTPKVGHRRNMSDTSAFNK